MNWKKIIKKSLDALELIAQLSPSEEERKKQAMQDIENTYDSAYYSGKMSYSLAEAYKDDFRNSLGLKKEN